MRTYLINLKEQGWIIWKDIYDTNQMPSLPFLGTFRGTWPKRSERREWISRTTCKFLLVGYCFTNVGYCFTSILYSFFSYNLQIITCSLFIFSCKVKLKSILLSKLIRTTKIEMWLYWICLLCKFLTCLHHLKVF